jgi:hypothetical protein
MQVALPVAIFDDIRANEGASPLPHLKAAADLTIVAFYFLLRVGEYLVGEPPNSGSNMPHFGVNNRMRPSSGSRLT